MFAVGTVLEGKYRVDRVLGRGGMGMVVAATHLTLGQPVALKFLHGDHLRDPEIVERFVREARAAAALRSEHVCRVSDVGVLDDGTPYIVMELLVGRDLASLLAAGGPLPVPTACDYLLQACLGLAEAHARSIVHRDLKPANLFLTRRPDGAPLIKVLDFGIAKAPGGALSSLTNPSSVLGSPGYMSPEQLRSSRDVDARSDLWSLGVILFELVTGAPPFTGQSIAELAIRVTLDPTPPLAGPRPRPAGFDDVVHRCLAKEPAGRYQDLAGLARALAAYAGPGGAELASAVSRLLGGSQLPAAGPASPAAPELSPPIAPTLPPDTPTTMGSAASSMVTGRSRSVRRGLAAGVAVIAAGVGIALAIASGGDLESGTGAPPSSASPAPAPVPPPAPAPAAAAAPEPPDPSGPGAAPADAGVEDAAARPPEQQAPPARPPARSPRPGRPPRNPSREEIGESRF